MAWVTSAIGGAVILFVLVDIFHTLANPGVLGWVTRTLLRLTWRASRRSRLAGPLAMLAVISLWGVLAVCGWALVYWPHVQDGFAFTGPVPGDADGLLDAFYISLVSISTLGLGDVYPTEPWLRILNPLEALFGFALLTVAVSWVLQVFPALTRRRVLALQLSHLQSVGTVDTLSTLDPAVAYGVIDRVAAGLVAVRVDLNDYPETYYFRETDLDASLAARVAVAGDLAIQARASGSPTLHHAGALLDAALDDLASVLRMKFSCPGPDTETVLSAFARDHRHEPRPRP